MCQALLEIMEPEINKIKKAVEAEGLQRGLQKGMQETKIETAKRLLQMKKLSYEEIAIGSGLTIEEVEELAGVQLV